MTLNNINVSMDFISKINNCVKSGSYVFKAFKLNYG